MAHEAQGPRDELTFDEELLLWLGDETPQVRAADAERVHDIAGEFARGFDALAHVERAVTVFGSARTPREHPHYKLVRELGACLGRAGYAIITGGGPGLMEAANRGAHDVHALSIGCNIELPHEQAALSERHISAADLAVLHVVKQPSEVCEIVDDARLLQRDHASVQKRRGITNTSS